MLEAFQYGSNPIFKEDIDACVRQESSQSKKRRSGQDRVTNGPQPHKQHPLHFAPIPKRQAQRLWTLFIRQTMTDRSAHSRGRFNDFAQALHLARLLVFIFFFNGSFIYKHNGNVVANGIDSMTLDAFQAAAVRFRFQLNRLPGLTFCG